MTASPIKLVKTAFIVYHHKNYETALQFFKDFGLQIERESNDQTFLRGYGTEPFIYHLKRAPQGSPSSFGGAAYVVESRSELERAEAVPGATKIAPLDAPGGGEVVTLTDPSGFKVHLVHGQEERQADVLNLEKLTVNYEDNKPRKGQFQRFKPGPVPVYRWGHYGVTYDAAKVGYDKMYTWYTQIIGLAPSDFVERDGKLVTCFFHVDRKKEYSDHHCFFFKPTKPGNSPDVAHAAFEVHDFDTQQMGHNYLESKGYELCWGVGRVSAFFYAIRFLDRSATDIWTCSMS